MEKDDTVASNPDTKVAANTTNYRTPANNPTRTDTYQKDSFEPDTEARTTDPATNGADFSPNHPKTPSETVNSKKRKQEDY